MKIIQVVCDRIDDELKDACWYAKKALEYKESYLHLADTFSKLSEEEMRHMTMLHSEVVLLIENYRKMKGEPPSDMMAVYNYLHQKSIDKAAEVKVLQAMYKG